MATSELPISLKRFQTTVADEQSVAKEDLASAILRLCSSTGATARTFGTYAMIAPCKQAKWDVTHATMISTLTAVVMDLAKLSTLLKLDLDTEVFGRAQTLLHTPTNDPTLLVLGMVVYANKLATLYVADKLTKGAAPTADSVATSIRLPNEPKDAVGPSFLAGIIALTGSILEVMARLEISLATVIDYGYSIVVPPAPPTDKKS
jgi:hypothetical protein